MENKTTIENTKPQENSIAIIAYITIIGLIVAFVMNSEKKNAFASYHIKQSLGIALFALAIMIVGMIPVLGWIISILGFFLIVFLWITGLVNAINGKKKPVPILGGKFEEWFKNIN